MSYMPRDEDIQNSIMKIVNEYFEYKKNGFYWKKRPAQSVTVGNRAGWIDKRSGYRMISVAGNSFKEHRVVWLFFKGQLPLGMIDHINGVRDDNRIENLRDVSNTENARNTYKHRAGKLHGTSYNKQYKKWESYAMVSKKIVLGYFETEYEAHQASVKFKKGE